MAETTTDPDAVFEREPLIDTFGESGAIRVLRVLVSAAGAPLPVRDIADQAHVSRATVYNSLPALIECGFITDAGTDEYAGGAKYRTVMDADTTQAFMDLLDTMIAAQPDD